jgi:hypothetical protein
MSEFSLVEWIGANKDWMFDGLGVAILSTIVAAGAFLVKKKEPLGNDASHDKIDIKQDVVVNSGEKLVMDMEEIADLGSRKEITRILFVDDDSRFKVVKILQNSGWRHTKTIKDVKTLDDADIKWADIFFIDVQGVGVSMGFADEGLGLALAIKEKYPDKKVVIYSAETKGDRFHRALRQADSFLPKDADPYEFQKIVEDLSGIRK